MKNDTESKDQHSHSPVSKFDASHGKQISKISFKEPQTIPDISVTEIPES